MKNIKINHRTLTLYTIISDEDYDLVSRYNWWLGSGGYVYTQKMKDNKRSTIFLHRLIMDTPKGVETDHINTDKLDNRRSNLRICNRGQNVANRQNLRESLSGYKGVRLSGKVWYAHISERIDGRLHAYCIGKFSDPITAARAYDTALREKYGKFAATIF